MITMAIVSVVLAVGVAHPFTKPVFMFLYNRLPFFKGYREPQKFVALLVLAYAFLGALGLDGLIAMIRNSKSIYNEFLRKVGKSGVVVLACALPLIYTYPIFWGFSGQLHSVDYPRSWYKANDILNSESRESGKVLFLPWHMYMEFDFARNPGPIYNPAQLFFDRAVIQGDNMEVYGIHSDSTNSISKRIEHLLMQGKRLENLGDRLVPLNIGYVMLSKNADYWNYGFLYKQKDLKVIYDTSEIVLFKNMGFDKSRH